MALYWFGSSATGEIWLNLLRPSGGRAHLISYRTTIPKVGLLKGVRETGLRIAFVLLATWPFILAFIVLREAMQAVF